MNVDILTIGNVFSQPVAPKPPATPKPQASAGKDRFSPVRGHSEQPTDVTPAEKPDRPPANTPEDSTAQEHKDFRAAIDKRTRAGDSERSSSRSETESQKTKPKTSDQPEAAQNVTVQNPDSPGQSKKGGAAKNAPDSRQQLVTLTAANKGKKDQQASSKAPEIQPNSNKTAQTHQTETGATKKPHNIPVDASIDKTGNRESSKKSNESASRTTHVIKEDNTKGQSSVAKAVGSTKIAAHDTLRTVAEESVQAATTKAPEKNAEYTASQKADSSPGQFQSIAQAKTAQAKAHPPTINTRADTNTRQAHSESTADTTEKAASTVEVQVKDTGRVEPTSTTDADIAGTQTPKRQIRPLGSKIANDGNSAENAVSSTTESKEPAARSQSGNSRSSGDSPSQNNTQVFTKNTGQTPVAEQTSTFTVETKAPILSEQPQAATGTGPEKVGNQILEAVRNSVSQQPTSDKEITIQLNPPELGKVSVKFLEQGAEITGTLEVSKAQTRAEIENALPEMIRNLADSGIAIKRLEVVLSQNDQPDQQPAKDPLLQDGEFQQQNSENPSQSSKQKQTTGTTQGPTGRSRYQYQTAADTYEMLLTNNSINMLV